LDASSLNESVAPNVPRFTGAKLTCTAQVAPTASVAPEHEFALRLNDESPVNAAVET
jgi:hypothetical protein